MRTKEAKRKNTTKSRVRASVSNIEAHLRLLEMNQSALQGRHYGLGAVADVEPHQNHAHVALDGGFGDAEISGDLLVAFAADDQAEHFALACAQLRIRQARRKSAADGRGQKTPSGVDAAQSARPARHGASP